MTDWITISLLAVPVVVLPIRSYQKSKGSNRVTAIVFIEYILLFSIAFVIIIRNGISAQDLKLNSVSLAEILKIAACTSIIVGFDYYSFLVLRRTRRYNAVDTLPPLQYAFSDHTILNKFCAVMFCALSAAWEELFFRAALFYFLRAMGIPVLLVVLISSLAFAANHLYNGKSSIYYSFCYGCVFSLLYWVTGSLASVFISHALGNIFVLFITVPQAGKIKEIVFI